MDIIPQSSKTAFNLEDQKDGQEIFCILIMKNSLIRATSFHQSVENVHIMQTRILILFSFYNMTRIYQEAYRIVGKGCTKEYNVGSDSIFYRLFCHLSFVFLISFSGRDDVILVIDNVQVFNKEKKQFSYKFQMQFCELGFVIANWECNLLQDFISK